MHKSFKQRLTELEALESAQKQQPDQEAQVQVAALSDTEVLASAFDGLRARTVLPTHGLLTHTDVPLLLVGVDAYSHAVATRTSAIYLATGQMLFPVTYEEAQLVIEGLKHDTLILLDWPARHVSGAYQLYMPPPYDIAAFEASALGKAAKAVAWALYVWSLHNTNNPDVVELCSAAEVVTLLERMCDDYQEL